MKLFFQPKQVCLKSCTVVLRISTLLSKVLWMQNIVVLKQAFAMPPTWLPQVFRTCCPLQYSTALDDTSFTCSIMFLNVKQNVMYGRWNVTVMGRTDCEAIS